MIYKLYQSRRIPKFYTDTPWLGGMYIGNLMQAFILNAFGFIFLCR